MNLTFVTKDNHCKPDNSMNNRALDMTTKKAKLTDKIIVIPTLSHY